MSRVRQRKSRRSMCTGKAARTEEGAKAQVEYRVAWGAYRQGINTYPCRWCGWYHVGGRNQELVARRRRR